MLVKYFNTLEDLIFDERSKLQNYKFKDEEYVKSVRLINKANQLYQFVNEVSQSNADLVQSIGISSAPIREALTEQIRQFLRNEGFDEE